MTLSFMKYMQIYAKNMLPFHRIFYMMYYREITVFVRNCQIKNEERSIEDENLAEIWNQIYEGKYIYNADDGELLQVLKESGVIN